MDSLPPGPVTELIASGSGSARTRSTPASLSFFWEDVGREKEGSGVRPVQRCSAPSS